MLKIITLDAMYRPRTKRRTLGSSNGTFLASCIITRMMARLVLTCQLGDKNGKRKGEKYIHLRRHHIGDV